MVRRGEGAECGFPARDGEDQRVDVQSEFCGESEEEAGVLGARGGWWVVLGARDGLGRVPVSSATANGEGEFEDHAGWQRVRSGGMFCKVKLKSRRFEFRVVVIRFMRA